MEFLLAVSTGCKALLNGCVTRLVVCINSYDILPVSGPGFGSCISVGSQTAEVRVEISPSGFGIPTGVGVVTGQWPWGLCLLPCPLLWGCCLFCFWATMYGGALCLCVLPARILLPGSSMPWTNPLKS